LVATWKKVRTAWQTRVQSKILEAKELNHVKSQQIFASDNTNW
jgi:hypothetical protein